MALHPDLGPVRVLTGAALALSLIAAASCIGPEERAVEELVRVDGRYLHPTTMEPYSGVAFATFESAPDVVARRLTLRDGTYDGPFEAYFESQQLSSKEVYENGVKNGPYEWYFENGQLFEEGTYRDGRLDGPYRAYWENGDLYEEGTYRDGRFEGPRRWYLDNRLVELVSYRDGVMDGLYERYLEDGTLDLKGMLRDGEPCGMWIEGVRTIHYPPCASRVVD